MHVPAHKPVRIRPAVMPVNSTTRVGDPPPLPIPAAPIVGREAEVDAALALLANPDVRLLTLTGPGGVGKTRLALHVASALDSDGLKSIWFIPLASVRDPDGVVPAIAAGLGVRESLQLPASAEIMRQLGDSDVLLVLDNIEQVIDSAPAIADLLAGLPNTKILITSREPLRISGEHVLSVPCLKSPDALRRQSALEIGEMSAVKLFVARASAAAPGFVLDDDAATAVAAICRRLDGLPLALELAATWIRVFPPQEILRLLGRRLPMLMNGPRDLPERQRTMNAAIGWSHDLIPPMEQIFFRRLAVFEGGFTIQAASVVCLDAEIGNDNESPSLLLAISALLDKNLLRRDELGSGPSRFSMLETVREYALERFAEDPDAPAVRTRHARWFLDFAEQTEASWQEPGSGSITAFLSELDDLRAALTWFEESGDATSMLRLAATLGSFWLHTGHLREGLSWLERAVTVGTTTSAPTDRISMAISWCGVLSTAAGDRMSARSSLEQALALRRETDNWEGVAHTLRHLGLLDITSGDLDSAEPLISESEALFRVHQHDSGQAMVLDMMAEIAYMRGELNSAARYSLEAVTVARRSGNRIRIVLALVGSAQVDLLVGSPDRALTCLREAVSLAQEVGFRFGVADAISCVASILGPRGDPARAVRLLAAATSIREVLSLDHFCHDEQYRRSLVASRTWLNDAAYTDAWKRGLNMDLDEAIAEAWGQPHLPESAPVSDDSTGLSPREREVLVLLAQGRSNPEIADVLSISRKTVAVHVSNILGRLGVESRSAAVAVAIRTNLV